MRRLEGIDPPTSEGHPSNPYRAAFYQRQSEWHGYVGVDDVLARHETRRRYYEWLTRGWLSEDRGCRVLEIGFGIRAPWPVPLDLKRSIYRGIVKGERALEGLWMRALGFVPPRIWSNVMWALAEKSTR